MVPHFRLYRVANHVDSEGLIRTGRGRVDVSADVGYAWEVGRSRSEVFHRSDIAGNPNESAAKLRESWIGGAAFEVRQLQVPPGQVSKAAGCGVRHVAT